MALPLVEDMFMDLANARDRLLKGFNSSLSKEDMMTNEERSAFSPPADILTTPKEYIFCIDVPGLAKSDVQVQLEEENILVIKSSGKRKREEGEEESCKYLKLERRPRQKMTRKFRLPQDANSSAISAKCENGVLTVTVKKTPPAKPKTVEVAIS